MRTFLYSDKQKLYICRIKTIFWIGKTGLEIPVPKVAEKVSLIHIWSDLARDASPTRPSLL